MAALPKILTSFIWFYVKKQKRAFLLIQCLGLAWAIDNTAWPYVFKLLIDNLNNYTPVHGGIWAYLAPTLLLWLGLWLLIECMFRTQGLISARIFPQFAANIRLSMFDYIQSHSYEYFANHFAGNIANRISDMVYSSMRIMKLITHLFIPAFVALLIALALFFTVNPIFSGILLVWICAHMGICFYAAKRSSLLSKIQANSRSALNGKIVDIFTNIINVKLFARSHFESEYVTRYQDDEQLKHQNALMFVEKVKVLLSINGIIFPGILMTVTQVYSYQHGLISLGDFVLIFNGTWNITMIAWFAGMELPNLFQEIGICQQALAVVTAPHDVIDKPNANAIQIQ